LVFPNMPVPEMRAGKHDSLAYCVVVNFATKPKTLATGPASSGRHVTFVSLADA